MIKVVQSKEDGKDQGLIQSSSNCTVFDPGYHMGK